METGTFFDLSVFDYVMVFGAALFASMLAGIGGFGGGFLVVIVLTPLLGAKAVIPMMAVFALFGNVSRLFFYYRDINWKIGSQFIAASLPGVAVGAEFFVWMPERPLLAFLGVSLICAIPLRRYLKRRAFSPGLKSIIVIGFLFGIVSGTSVGSGMFVIASLTSMGMIGPVLLGTDALIGAVNAISRGTAFFLHGVLTVDLIIAGTMISLATIPGTWIASKLVHKLGDKRHGHLIEGMIFIGGAMLIYKSIF